MDFRFTAEQEDFRQEVRRFVADKLPAAIRHKVEMGLHLDKADYVTWQTLLYEQGWAAPNWPQEHGGPGWSLAEQYIFSDEAGKMGAPSLSFGVTMIGPLIIECGDD